VSEVPVLKTGIHRQVPLGTTLTALAALAGMVAGIAIVCPGSSPCAGASPEDVASIMDTLRISEWHYLGPFSVGPREGITGIADLPEDLLPPDAAAPAGEMAVPGEPAVAGGGEPLTGDAAVSGSVGVPANRRYPSMLAQGGYVQWRTAVPDSSGWVTLTFDNVFWDSLAATYGAAGVVNVTYAFAEVERPAQERALVVAERVGSFYLNGDLFPGDPYGHNFVRIPVMLRAGVNRILVKLSGYGDPAFKLEMIPAPAPLILVDDYTAPDLVRGEMGRVRIGVPILNTTAARISEAMLTVGDGDRIRTSRHTITNLTALGVRKIPVQVEIAAPAEGESLRVPLEIAADGMAYRDTLTLRVREAGQSVKRTFISRIDGSCQYYAVLPPTEYDPEQQYALILTLHGAGVRAEGQADAYKPKPWAFIVAPTNRRPYGFDWQDWGRLDALEVLAEAKAAYRIDPDRVYLTGHSMGGHGVWHVGLAHPDLFAAMAPGAGWTSFELYIPWFLQKSSIYAEPSQLEARNLSLRADQALNFVENARNLPIFIFQGGADDNVPPVHPRMFVTRLDQLGYDYEYKEIPGKGHWWGIDSLGTSCVDDPDLMNFVRGRRRATCPSRVTLKTTDLSKTSRAYWVEITRQVQPARDSWIDAELVAGLAADAGSGVPGSGDAVTANAAGESDTGSPGACAADICTAEVRTANVAEFALHPCGEMLAAKLLRIMVDGKTWIVAPHPGERIGFALRGGEFRLGEHRIDGLAKSAASCGPIKQAYFSPFVLVYGTAGGEAATELLLHQARLEAMQWWIRGNGFAQVMPDSEVTRDTVATFNLILFGGPGENRVTRAINRHMPISIVGGRFKLGGTWIETQADRPGKADGEGQTLAAKFVYPNPLNPDKLVVIHEGIGMEGLRLATFFGTLSSGAGLPDYMVFDASVRTRGWAGVAASGFFNTGWQPR